MMEVAVLVHGTGNLHTLAKALESHGARVRFESSVPAALTADAIVLPALGTFAGATAHIGAHTESLASALDAGMPALGIGVGMHVLFESSEDAPGAGVGAFRGAVRRIRAQRMPHIGWDDARTGPDPLFAGAGDPVVVYYATGMAAEPAAGGDVIAWAEYGGDRFPAAVRSGNTWGVQFQPEKSGQAGLRMLHNFIAQVGRMNDGKRGPR